MLFEILLCAWLGKGCFFAFALYIRSKAELYSVRYSPASTFYSMTYLDRITDIGVQKSGVGLKFRQMEGGSVVLEQGDQIFRFQPDRGGVVIGMNADEARRV